MLLNNIKALIIDVHRTLVDDTGFPRDRIWRLLEDSGVKVDFDSYYRLYDNLTKKLFNWPQINPFVTIHEIHRRRLKQFYQQYGVIRDIEADLNFLWEGMGSSEIYPEVPPVLKRLKRRYPIALLSNADNDDPLIQILLDRGFEFDAIVTSEQCGCYKPNAKIFSHVLEELQLNADDVIMIGDSPASDITGARNAGIKVVWVNREGIKLNGKYPKPDFTISNLQQLLKIIPA